MLHLNNKNSAFTALFTALVFSTSVAMAEITKTTEPTAETTQTETTTKSTSKAKTTRKEKEKKEDVGSSAYSVVTALLTSVSPMVTSELTSGKDDKSKRIIQAKNDAATFIASQGEVRGAYLEAAIQQLRKEIPTSQADDTQLAQAILIW